MTTFVLSFVGHDQKRDADLYRVSKSEPKLSVDKSGDVFVEVTYHLSYPDDSSHHVLAKCRECRNYDCEHAIFVQRRINCRRD